MAVLNDLQHSAIHLEPRLFPGVINGGDNQQEFEYVISEETGGSFTAAMANLPVQAEDYVPQVVSLLLKEARAARASDVHLVPGSGGMKMLWRLDGVLQAVAVFDAETGTRLVARLKVICGLLTYRTDLPQEGRVSREYSATEIRVTTFPTLYGEKAAIRLFAGSDDLKRLDQLGLPLSIEQSLRHQLLSTDGVILLTGPSGSGKTTTVYACLREILQASGDGRSVMTLEDPIEVAVDGTTQSQVRTSSGFDLMTGLRSLMRQDPDVIMVGEIRDPATAEAAFQASLTGHLVLTTFHAGSCVEAIARLLDMHLEPYVLRSSLRSVVCQRLVRQIVNPSDLEKQSDKSAAAAGHHVYKGRRVIAEMLTLETPELARAVMRKSDTRELARIVQSCGIKTLRDVALNAVSEGVTTEEEVFRVLGMSPGSEPVAQL
ncbi:MAG: type II/IV secretion system protein [Planctomycetaceae bacterium]|nr:type II/IV secretion system protein [Planctomycetaceae bacterium]